MRKILELTIFAKKVLNEKVEKVSLMDPKKLPWNKNAYRFTNLVDSLPVISNISFYLWAAYRFELAREAHFAKWKYKFRWKMFSCGTAFIHFCPAKAYCIFRLNRETVLLPVWSSELSPTSTPNCCLYVSQQNRKLFNAVLRSKNHRGGDLLSAWFILITMACQLEFRKPSKAFQLVSTDFSSFYQSFSGLMRSLPFRLSFVWAERNPIS